MSVQARRQPAPDTRSVATLSAGDERQDDIGNAWAVACADLDGCEADTPLLDLVAEEEGLGALLDVDAPDAGAAAGVPLGPIAPPGTGMSYLDERARSQGRSLSYRDRLMLSHQVGLASEAPEEPGPGNRPYFETVAAAPAPTDLDALLPGVGTETGEGTGPITWERLAGEEEPDAGRRRIQEIIATIDATRAAVAQLPDRSVVRAPIEPAIQPRADAQRQILEWDRERLTRTDEVALRASPELLEWMADLDPARAAYRRDDLDGATLLRQAEGLLGEVDRNGNGPVAVAAIPLEVILLLESHPGRPYEIRGGPRFPLEPMRLTADPEEAPAPTTPERLEALRCNLIRRAAGEVADRIGTRRLLPSEVFELGHDGTLPPRMSVCVPQALATVLGARRGRGGVDYFDAKHAERMLRHGTVHGEGFANARQVVAAGVTEHLRVAAALLLDHLDPEDRLHAREVLGFAFGVRPDDVWSPGVGGVLALYHRAHRQSVPGRTDIAQVDNQLYTHGGFMANAVDMLQQRRWCHILELLMPDVYNQTLAVFEGQEGAVSSGKLAAMYENNPVLAAWGAARTRELDAKDGGDRAARLGAIEWDVFLPTGTTSACRRDNDPRRWKAYAQMLAESCLIAHGNADDTLKENLSGLDASRRYSKMVRERAKTDQGGALSRDWMDVFARALTLGTSHSFQADFERERLVDRSDAPNTHEALRGALDEGTRLTMSEAVDVVREVLGVERFSVVLDIKSRDATPRVLRALVEGLNEQGIHVAAVGSFTTHEIRGLAANGQAVAGEAASSAGPREITFHHLVGDFQTAADKGEVMPGQSRMFNGASLRPLEPDACNRIVGDLRRYKALYDVHLGLYVQESDIGPDATAALVRLANDNPDLFDLGFAWGGVSGTAPRGPADATGYGSQGGIGAKVAAGAAEALRDTMDTRSESAGRLLSTLDLVRDRMGRPRLAEVFQGWTGLTLDPVWSVRNMRQPGTVFKIGIRPVENYQWDHTLWLEVSFQPGRETSTATVTIHEVRPEAPLVGLDRMLRGKVVNTWTDTLAFPTDWRSRLR